MELRVQCGGSVDIDGQPLGRLDEMAYQALASLVPDDHGTGWEYGDSITVRVDTGDIVRLHNYPWPPRREPEGTR